MHGTTHHSSHRSQVRFYIVMITLVLGGIIFLLLLNNNGQDFNFTSAIIGDITEKSRGEITSQDTMEKVPTTERTVMKPNREIEEISLTYSKIPKISSETNFKEARIQVRGATSSNIRVNGDKLEINNKDVVLVNIKEFTGKILFDDLRFDLEGSADLIEIDGVALSSKDKIELSFKETDYDVIGLLDFKLEKINLFDGDGTLSVGEKLRYVLEKEDTTIYNYQGVFVLSKNNNATQYPLSLKGTAQGLSTEGNKIDLSLG